MFLQLVFVSLLQLLFGLVFLLAGFRLFVLLMPLWGFFAGFLVTAQAIQELFGGGFLASISSWVFGFVVGALCAAAAYFFYYAAVTILCATVGYELGVGLMAGLGVVSGVVLFIVGLVVAAVLAATVIFFNLPRTFIVVLTALAGAGMILTGILLALGRVSLVELNWGIVGAFIRASWFWSLLYLALAAAGIVAQLRLPEEYLLEPYGQDELSRRMPVHGQLDGRSPSGRAPAV